MSTNTSTITYVFPALYKYQAETPLWLDFQYFSYSDYYENRDKPTLGDPKKRFLLPLPQITGSGVKIKASDSATDLSSTRVGGFPSDFVQKSGASQAPGGVRTAPPLHQQGTNGLLYQTESGLFQDGMLIGSSINQGNVPIGMYGRILSGAPTTRGTLITTGANNEGYVDIMDTAWYGQNKKQYTFKFAIYAKSEECSKAAYLISNEFTNLILPSISNLARSTAQIYNISVTHPGVWWMKVLNNSGKDQTKAWIGAYPQPCLLLSAAAYREGPKEGAISGMISSAGENLYFPIRYVIELKMQEIEPTYISASDISSKESVAMRRSLLLKSQGYSEPKPTPSIGGN